MTVYTTFEDAAWRVERLKESGIWPGIVCHANGTYSLTYDPEDRSGQ